MGVLFSYVLLGLSLAAPIGPVNAAQLDRGIKYGFLHAWLVGVGAVLADGVYMLIVYLGLVSF
ncbi:LysE family translocator, partial [Aeromonas veronii]|nr:LysE family translocator [Aeromonas veronii]